MLFKQAQGASSSALGFSILELAVVVAVLGILSSIALPNIKNFFDYNNVDELKALMNTAAADCLQKNRVSNKDNQPIDDAILSDAKLSTLGYRINPDPDFSTCSSLEVLPIDEKDAIRFPIRFSILQDGTLFKSATATEYNESDRSCRSWAGVNCKASAELKEFIAYNKQIQEAQTSCNTAYSNWFANNPSSCSSFNRWDSSATSNCPSRPPKQVSQTCTPNGCNVRVFAFEGKAYNSEDSCNQALSDKYQALCDSWVDSRKQTDNAKGKPATYEYCGSKKYWFCEGEDKKNQTAMDACLDEKEFAAAEAKCKADLGKAVQQNQQGEWPTATYQSQFASLNSIPQACTEKTWICKGSTYSSEESYNSCMNPPRPTNPFTPTNPFNPTNPSQPSRPTNPFNPTNPSGPSTPTRPGTPWQPTTPTGPRNPWRPNNPGAGCSPFLRRMGRC